nr:hypothetical protein [Parabacteroides sp.]
MRPVTNNILLGGTEFERIRMALRKVPAARPRLLKRTAITPESPGAIGVRL